MNRWLHPASYLLFLALHSAYLRALPADLVKGSKIFASNCAGCHGSDGRGGERAPNIATARNVSALSDTEIENFVRNGMTGSGMPAFAFMGDENLRDVVAFLRRLQGKTAAVQVVGDAQNGAKLFHEQAGCSSCHMMHGKGGFIASDLSNYGSGIEPDKIRKAILDPESFTPAGSEVVEVTTATGESLRGVMRTESNFFIVLQTENGRYRRLEKKTLKKITYTGHSLMPSDYTERLSFAEVNDIIAYLARSEKPVDPVSSYGKTGDH